MSSRFNIPLMKFNLLRILIVMEGCYNTEYFSSSQKLNVTPFEAAIFQTSLSLSLSIANIISAPHKIY